MTRQNVPLHTFNRGRISTLALARTDLDRTRMSAEIQTNWMPRTLGSMMLRPGLGYINETYNNLRCRMAPFVFRATDTAMMEFTSTRIRFYINPPYTTSTNGGLMTRSFVKSSATNGTFSSSLTGWTDADDSGSSSIWVTGNYMGLAGTKYKTARRRQEIAVPATDTNVEHGIRITVERGKPKVKIGSAAGNDDYVVETELRPGTYSFCLVPSSNIHVEFSANTEYLSLVKSIAIESTNVGLSETGVVSLPAPWGESDLDNLRWEQSGDVLFLACGSTVPQQRIERYGAGSSTGSWAIVDYVTEDGPFGNINTGSKRINPSGLSGDITLQASEPLFHKTKHVGALFRLTSVGQDVQTNITGSDQWSDDIRVSGVGSGRQFSILITQSTGFTSTIRVQRSVGETGSWSNVSGLSYTSTQDTTYTDSLDNQIAFYRIGAGSTDYTDGTAHVELSYSAGGITGVAKIVAVTSSTNTDSTAASAIVLNNLGSTAATDLWSEGDWSILRGYPSAVAFHEGRLWWAGKSKIWGSVSDAYESFDPDTEGDSGPINRSIGFGPVDKIQWMTSLGRLIIGTGGNEIQVKTGTLDDPITPTNFNLRAVSNQGSANVQAVTIDNRALFTQRGGTRAMETAYSGNSLDYETADRTVLIPEMGNPSFTKMAVQRQPDTRLHCVRGSTDGTVAVLVSDPAEDVTCWVDINTGDADGVNGVVEDVVVLPGIGEDSVFYQVKREINGSTHRFIEKWAKESEAVGGPITKLVDSHIVQESTATTLVTGLDHLIGETVAAWGGTGKDLGTYTVVASSSGSTQGQITLSEASTSTVVGLPYTAWFKSVKLAYAAQMGTALTQKKRVNHLGLIAQNLHARGLQFGPATSTSIYGFDNLPPVESSAVSTDTVYSAYDETPIPFPGTYDTDSRIVLKAASPRPATVLGAIIDIETKEKV